MEALFTTDFIVNGQNKSYAVFFEKDEYVFHPTQNGEPTFSLRRDHDEWQANGINDEIATQHAVHALEQYLLSQH